ncbi:type I iodothyronine deiodinase-like [Glandiceps talaboti]
MASFITDRALVIKILRRYKELMFAEETMRVYDQKLHPYKTDPSRLAVAFVEVLYEVEATVLKENGVEPDELSASLSTLITRHYSNDKEVIDMIAFRSSHGAKDWIGDLKVGDARPDVNLVSMETKEAIPLSRLHLDKDRPLAIIHSGSLYKLHQDYKVNVDFLYIYILEAHPKDGWPLGAHYSSHYQHVNVDERIAAARRLIEADSQYQTFTSNVQNEVKVRMVVDTMENMFAQTYASQPNRAFVIKNDKMAFIGNT